MLEALCRIEAPLGGWELIAADNNSTDSSRTILEDYRDRLPLQILSVPRKGKSVALNQAITHVRGDLVVFTDDDILPDPNWLVAYRQCAAQNPEYDVFGGSVLPAWERTPPQWVLDWVPLGSVYGILDHETDGPCRADRIWGANLACRRSVLDKGHRFDETIGPGAPLPFDMGEDAEFVIRLAKLGHKPYRCTAALVQHQINADCVNEDWILQRAIRVGMSVAQLGLSPYAQRSRADENRSSPDETSCDRRLNSRLVMDYILFSGAAMLLSLAPASRRRFSVLWRRNIVRGRLEHACKARKARFP